VLVVCGMPIIFFILSLPLYVEMKTRKKIVTQYERECPVCGKKLTGFNERQLNWNYNIHITSCKAKQKKEAMKNETMDK